MVSGIRVAKPKLRKKTVEAQSEAHLKLIEEGWKPIYAYQSFTMPIASYNKYYTGKTGACYDLKPKSALYVVMRKEEKDE